MMMTPKYLGEFRRRRAAGEKLTWAQLYAEKGERPGWKQEMEGLGDVVESATNRLGMQGCTGCSHRKWWMNKWFPLKLYYRFLMYLFNRGWIWR